MHLHFLFVFQILQDVLVLLFEPAFLPPILAFGVLAGLADPVHEGVVSFGLLYFEFVLFLLDDLVDHGLVLLFAQLFL